MKRVDVGFVGIGTAPAQPVYNYQEALMLDVNAIEPVLERLETEYFDIRCIAMTA